MSDREKLAELVCESVNDECSRFCNSSSPTKCFQCVCIADYLLANGVTSQKWISVEDELPKENREAVLIFTSWRMVDIGWYDKDDKCWQSEFISEYDEGEIIHWMPLPEPPKEG